MPSTRMLLEQMSVWSRTDASLIPHPFIRCLLCGPGAGNTEMIKTLWFLTSRSSYFIRGTDSTHDDKPERYESLRLRRNKKEVFTLSEVAEFPPAISHTAWQRQEADPLGEEERTREGGGCQIIGFPKYYLPSPCKERFWEPYMSQMGLSQEDSGALIKQNRRGPVCVRTAQITSCSAMWMRNITFSISWTSRLGVCKLWCVLESPGGLLKQTAGQLSPKFLTQWVWGGVWGESAFLTSAQGPTTDLDSSCHRRLNGSYEWH